MYYLIYVNKVYYGYTEDYATACNFIERGFIVKTAQCPF